MTSRSSHRSCISRGAKTGRYPSISATSCSAATADGRAGIAQGRGVAYSVEDLGIRTVALNPQTGESGLRQVTHVWKFDVPLEDQILVRTRQGVEQRMSVHRAALAIFLPASDNPTRLTPPEFS